MIGTRSPKSAATCAASVGLTCPLMLALGAATGTRALRITACATGCDGTRIAIVSRPASAKGAIGMIRYGVEHQGHRAGPEGRRQALRQRRPYAKPPRGLGHRHVNDQRVEGRTALGGKDPGDGKCRLWHPRRAHTQSRSETPQSRPARYTALHASTPSSSALITAIVSTSRTNRQTFPLRQL